MAKKKEQQEEKVLVNKDNEEIIKSICRYIPDAEILSNDALAQLGFITTGNLALDFVCSGRFWEGGIPMGRITEILGKSSTGKTVIGTHILQGVQNMGGIAVLIDSESAYSASFGEILGLDTQKLIYLQPQCLEDCFQRIIKIVEYIRDKSTDMRPIVIVYDSIAASPSRKETEKTKKGDDIGSLMGHRALVCSDYLRNIAGFLAKQKAAVVVLNQLRSKVGVMYGCFSHDARVMLEDGSVEMIGRIVEKKMDVKVRSYNKETGKIEARKIVNWFRNGKTDHFLNIMAERPSSGGMSCFNCTENHMILTPTGEVSAGSLRVGDMVMSQVEVRLSDIQRKLVVGSILGDGSLNKTGKNSSALVIGHGIQQEEYCKWKKQILSNVVSWSGYNKAGSYYFCTTGLHELSGLRKLTYDDHRVNKKRKIITRQLVDEMDLLSLAIWYLDDGSFGGSYNHWGNGKSTIACPVYSQEELDMLADKIASLGIPRPICTVRKGLRFTSEGTAVLQEKISKYVPPCMAYKIKDVYRAKYDEAYFENVAVPSRFDLAPMRVAKIEAHRVNPNRNNYKYDIEVEGNHNYFVSGVCVHNSPDVGAGGGNSLEYYCSLILQASKKANLKDSKERSIGIQMTVKNTKNKVARPFRVAEEIELFYDQGIVPTSGLLSMLLQEERVSKNGGWYTIAGTDDKFQEKGFVEALIAHPQLVDAPSSEALENYLRVNRQSLERSLNEEILVGGEADQENED